MKRALITGITGQDGSYLAEFLLLLGYEVHGIVRSITSSQNRFSNIIHLLNKIIIHSGSLESYPSIFNIVDKVRPHECYHLAAQSFVGYSFKDEFSTMDININGTHHIISAIKLIVPKCKFYFAATSEMFGNAEKTPQTEKTAFNPRSTYGISKVTGFQITKYYREAHNLFACNGILFNHESPRRGLEFVTRKITHTVARIKLGLARKLVLGNVMIKRDWGFAKDYVEAMWMMLQKQNPDDYVIATNKIHTIKQFLSYAFDYVGLDWKSFVECNDYKFQRPTEIFSLRGDYLKAKQKLGWKPKVMVKELAEIMVESDILQIKQQQETKCMHLN